MSSKNDGKSLELIVRLIESLLLPQGFEVETRERLFNDAGVQIAEFDIVVRGTRDSNPFLGLIECRDRPGNSAPGSWIEQLYGRKHRFGFSKVMAVSTSGFSEGAQIAAKDLGIELRNLEHLTVENVTHWVPRNIHLTIRHGTYSSVTIILDKDEAARLPDLKVPIGTSDALIKMPNKKELKTIKEIWQLALNKNSHYFDDLEPNSPPKQAKVIVRYSPLEALVLKIKQESYNISEIQFDANLSVVTPKVPLTQLAKYYEHKKSDNIATVLQWEAEDTTVIKSLFLIGINKENKPGEKSN